MSILNKIWTALRGGAREIGEAVVDANGVRIFEQEIRDAEDNIANANRQITEIMAHQIQAERQVSALNEDIGRHEGFATKALEQQNEPLALDVAQKIADLEIERDQHQASATRLASQVAQLREHIKNAERMLVDYRRELAIVATTESVQKATEQVVENVAINHSAMNSARQSLERIKKRQEMKQDQMTAGDILAKEATASTLDAKLEAAGIKPPHANAAAVLERIRNTGKPA